MTNDEVERMLDLYERNKALKKELAMANAILEVLKSRGFESEIIYIKYKIENNLKRNK